MVVRTSRRTPALRRLLVVVATLALSGVALVGVGMSETGRSAPPPVPEARCGPGARPETDIQGRVPQRDYDSGRAAKGYRCNTRPVSHVGSTGGFKTIRYVDPAGHTCAFYDSTLLFPKDVPASVVFTAGEGTGVVVLDMDRPAHPKQTANLVTPGMETPHESVLLNRKRGILAAESGNPATAPGVLDLYDVRTDCRHPQLLSTTPTSVLGHESGFSHDGKTYYASSTGGQTLTAIDVSDPTAPQILFSQGGVNYHGMRVSRNDKLLYVANIGTDGSGAQFANGGLRILDVSEIQARKPDPQVKILSDLTWPEMSIPQVPQPFVKHGHHYLLEVDEYANYSLVNLADQSSSPVGAARIIDVDDPRHARIVSNIRLAVHQPAARKGPEKDDPGADSPVQGYAGHYCSVPRYRNPKLAACSMILSGLRVFDISDPGSPREVAYFNKPLTTTDPANPTAEGAFAMSQPAWDVKRHSIWYTDGNTGFYDVRLTNGVGRLLE